MFTKFNYNDGIKLLKEQKDNLGKIIESLHIAKVTTTSTQKYLETHLTNYCIQLSSFELLTSGTKPFSDSNTVYFDLSSINILTRALIENYFSIHYLYFETIGNVELAEFRQYLYSIHGLNIRQEMQKEIVPSDSDKLKLVKEKVLLEELTEKLKGNKVFKNLRLDKQRQLLKNKPARDVSPTQLVSKLYFQSWMFKQAWEHLCNYAHTDFIAVLQLKSIYENHDTFKQMPSLIRQPLFSTIMLNASMLINLNKRFKAAEIVYVTLPEFFRINNEFWYKVSQDKD